MRARREREEETEKNNRRFFEHYAPIVDSIAFGLAAIWRFTCVYINILHGPKFCVDNQIKKRTNTQHFSRFSERQRWRRERVSESDRDRVNVVERNVQSGIVLKIFPDHVNKIFIYTRVCLLYYIVVGGVWGKERRVRWQIHPNIQI